MNKTSNITRQKKNTRKLIYIIGTYPLLTTTFIDREIIQLRRWGIDIDIISIRKPSADTPLSAMQQELQRDVRYLLPASLLKLLLSHLFFAFSRPGLFFGTCFYLLTRPHPSFSSWIKTLLHVSEGVYGAFLVKNERFSEFQAHFIDRAATLALVMGRLLDKPYTLSIHAAEDIFVHPVLLNEKICEARHAVTCTQYNKTHLETLLNKNLDQKITHIPHGLDITRYPKIEIDPEKNNLILAVGQLAERKGFTTLVEACRRLKDRGIRFQCQIIGQGPQQEILAEMIVNLAIEDCVSLCGALPHEDVIKHYANSKMLVMPSIQSKDGNLDGIPNVLFEAMAMGIPVISTRISAIPELVQDGENGILVFPGDSEALAEAMEILINSPIEAVRLGGKGRSTILAEFDVETNVARFATTLWPQWFLQETFQNDQMSFRTDVNLI